MTPNAILHITDVAQSLLALPPETGATESGDTSGRPDAFSADRLSDPDHALAKKIRRTRAMPTRSVPPPYQRSLSFIPFRSDVYSAPGLPDIRHSRLLARMSVTEHCTDESMAGAVSAMMEIAEIKGWKKCHLTGSDRFKRLVAVAAARQGLRISGVSREIAALWRAEADRVAQGLPPSDSESFNTARREPDITPNDSASSDVAMSSDSRSVPTAQAEAALSTVETAPGQAEPESVPATPDTLKASVAQALNAAATPPRRGLFGRPASNAGLSFGDPDDAFDEMESVSMPTPSSTGGASPALATV